MVRRVRGTGDHSVGRSGHECFRPSLEDLDGQVAVSRGDQRRDSTTQAQEVYNNFQLLTLSDLERRSRARNGDRAEMHDVEGLEETGLNKKTKY